MKGGPRKLSVLREEIRRVVKAAAAPLALEDIGNRIKATAGRSRLAKTLANMRASGEVVSERGEDGVRYSAGPKLLGGSVKTKSHTTPKLSAGDAAIIETSLRKAQHQLQNYVSPRWALASDGAFVLLGTPIEIPRPAAHALVEFIDVLRRGTA